MTRPARIRLGSAAADARRLRRLERQLHTDWACQDVQPSDSDDLGLRSGSFGLTES